VLTDLLVEFTSARGLRVKVLKNGPENVFPGGLEFHYRFDIMKEILNGMKLPYVFHMSWTRNKDVKKQYYQQLGEWYVDDEAGLENSSTVTSSSGANSITSCGTVTNSTNCCLAKPNVVCHYRNKPSKIPCPHSPRMEDLSARKDNVSFW